MNKKIAYAIWPWGSDEKEQVIKAIQDVSKLGYKYYENMRTCTDLFAPDPDELWRVSEEYGVKPISFYFHLSDDPAADFADAKKRFPLLQKHGVEVISLQAMGVPGGNPSKEQLDATLDTVRRLGELGREYGVKPCLHPHVNTAVTFAHDIDYIMDNTDPQSVFMGPDTAHLKAAGCDPLAMMTRYASRIRFTHIKDLADAEASAIGYQNGVEVYSNFVELGKGDIAFAPIFKMLKDNGYTGYYCVELDRSKTTNTESARNNLDFMEQSLL